VWVGGRFSTGWVSQHVVALSKIYILIISIAKNPYPQDVP